MSKLITNYASLLQELDNNITTATQELKLYQDELTVNI